MRRLVMTVLAALIAGACGPPIDRMQDQLSEAHDALPEVNELAASTPPLTHRARSERQPERSTRSRHARRVAHDPFEGVQSALCRSAHRGRGLPRGAGIVALAECRTVDLPDA